MMHSYRADVKVYSEAGRLVGLIDVLRKQEGRFLTVKAPVSTQGGKAYFDFLNGRDAVTNAPFSAYVRASVRNVLDAFAQEACPTIGKGISAHGSFEGAFRFKADDGRNLNYDAREPGVRTAKPAKRTRGPCISRWLS